MRWTIVVAACVGAAAIGVALTRVGQEPSPPAMVRPASPPELARALAPARVAPAVPMAPTAVKPATGCALQALSLARDGTEPRTVCMDATLVRQTGNVRSYVVNPGDAEGWSLRVDMVDRSLLSAALEARDGRRHACEAGRCQGIAMLAPADAAERLSLRGLRLPPVPASGAAAEPGPDDLLVSAELRVPPDDQVPGLACVGPSVAMATAGGAARNFCGQGGAGVEIVGDGRHNYRFQDLEGRTLMISVDAEQRVVGIELDTYGCRGTACSGASTSSAAADNPLAERSFYFGRTPLFDGGPANGARPALVLNGSLVMPSQQ